MRQTISFELASFSDLIYACHIFRPQKETQEVNFKLSTSGLACVASVSVGVSAGLKHFSLFERAKIRVSAKKWSSQFSRRHKAKNPVNGEKKPRKRLLRRLHPDQNAGLTGGLPFNLSVRFDESDLNKPSLPCFAVVKNT